MNAKHEDDKKCPLNDVDRRLEDAHNLWHQAERNYFDPEGFRLAAQSTIQTLRTVTWLLQAKRDVIPKFEEWYGGHQNDLRADGLMRWLVDARNKIEKRGDLETHSFVRAKIIGSYLKSENPTMEVRADLFDGPGALLRKIPRHALQAHFLKHGVLSIERRWIENNLPSHELLDALAIAYGCLARIIHDAHKQIGCTADVIRDHTTGELLDGSKLNGKLPCMIAHEENRILNITLRDGSILGSNIRHISFQFDEAKQKEITDRYGDPTKIMSRSYNSMEELVTEYFKMVRGVFEKDGRHITVAFLFSGTRLLKVIEVRVEDQAQKFLAMQTLANEVVRRGADGVVYVSEAWVANAEDLAPFERPGESAKNECLSLALATKEAAPTYFSAIIKRENEKSSLGETIIQKNVKAFSLAPLYDAWGSDIPKAWTIKSEQ